MKIVICKHRDCDIEFTSSKGRYKFCCKDCYRLERNKALYEKNQAKKKKQEDANNVLHIMAQNGDEYAIEKLKLIKLQKEYEDAKARKVLCCEIIDYFGGDIGEYSNKEIAEFFGMKRCTIDKIVKKFTYMIKENEKLRRIANA